MAYGNNYWIPQHPNVSFYEGKINALPNYVNIDDILRFWPADFYELENNHKYIQWLFPNRDPGLNSYAFTIHPEEPKIFNSRPHLRMKLKRAFEMMLQFFGMRLTSDDKFELTENSAERLLFLNTKNNHNFNRITRILKCLLEFGHNKLMLPWLKFLAKLIYEDKTLNEAEDSFQKFWMPVLDAEDSIQLRKFLDKLPKSQSNQESKHSPSLTSNVAGTQEGNSASSTHKYTGSAERMPTSSYSENAYSYEKTTSEPEERKHRTTSKIIAFYKNEIPLPKTGLFINDILSKPDKYMLEKNSIYMHWLFPNEISGTFQSEFFSAADAEEIRETPALKGQVLKAFKMMLEFYGMELTKDETFLVPYSEKLYPLMLNNTPDPLKITRILRSLKELGHKDLMLPWLKFLACLIYERKRIPGAATSMEKYWMDTLDKKEKRELSDYINVIKK